MNNETLLIEVLKAQVANPKRAIVNGEASFVRYKVESMNKELATKYWRWICSNRRDREAFGPEVNTLQDALDKIDSESKMPSWGISGT